MSARLSGGANHSGSASTSTSLEGLPADIRLAQDTMDVVVPFKRSNADKFFDYLLGEGPNNRFALICRRCGTHNGLIREEDLGLRELVAAAVVIAAHAIAVSLDALN